MDCVCEGPDCANRSTTEEPSIYPSYSPTACVDEIPFWVEAKVTAGLSCVYIPTYACEHVPGCREYNDECFDDPTRKN